MKKPLAMLLVLLFLVNVCYARKGKRDVVYLKNGSIINGHIIGTLPSGQVKIRTKDKSLWVFEAPQIDSVFHAQTAGPMNYNVAGYFNLTEAGILAGNNANKYNAPFSLMDIVGLRFKNGFAAGAGAGVEMMSETYLPVVADFRCYIKHQGINPFFALQGGYSFALDKPDKQFVYNYTGIWPGSGNTLDMKAKGGFLVNPSVGISAAANENLTLLFSLGYRVMRHRYDRSDNYKIDIDYNRLSVKIGLLFK